MWKAVIGILLLIGTLTRDNFGFAGGSGAEVIGYNLGAILMIVAGIWLTYSGLRNKQKIN